VLDVPFYLGVPLSGKIRGVATSFAKEDLTASDHHAAALR
jgi:hypothetical protein